MLGVLHSSSRVLAQDLSQKYRLSTEQHELQQAMSTRQTLCIDDPMELGRSLGRGGGLGLAEPSCLGCLCDHSLQVRASRDSNVFATSGGAKGSIRHPSVPSHVTCSRTLYMWTFGRGAHITSCRKGLATTFNACVSCSASYLKLHSLSRLSRFNTNSACNPHPR